MRILERYILRECLTFFSVALFAFTGILLTIQMLKFSNLIINRGVEIGQILLVFSAIIPTFLELALPLSALLGVMLAFARLSGDSEIIVLRSSGVSLYQLLRPITFLALILGLAAITVSLQLKPWGNRALSTALLDIAKTRTTAGLDQGIFNKLGDLTLYAEKIDYDTGELTRAVVDDRRDDKDRKVIFAKSGRILSNEESHSIEILLNDGMMHEQNLGKYVITRFEANNVSISPDELYGQEAQTERPPRSLYLQELRDQIETIKNSPPLVYAPVPLVLSEKAFAAAVPGKSAPDRKKRLRRLSMERALRFSLPCATIILAFAALPLGVQPPRTQRNWGSTVSFLLGLLVFVIYYAVLSIGMTFVDSGKISAGVAAWLPNILVCIATIYLIHALGSEKLQSVAQLFDRPISWIGRIRSRIRVKQRVL